MINVEREKFTNIEHIYEFYKKIEEECQNEGLVFISFSKVFAYDHYYDNCIVFQCNNKKYFRAIIINNKKTFHKLIKIIQKENNVIKINNYDKYLIIPSNSLMTFYLKDEKTAMLAFEIIDKYNDAFWLNICVDGIDNAESFCYEILDANQNVLKTSILEDYFIPSNMKFLYILKNYLKNKKQLDLLNFVELKEKEIRFSDI